MAKEFVIKNGLIINDTHAVTGITNDSGLTYNNARLATEDAIKKYIDNSNYWTLNTNILSPESSGYTINIENDTSSTSPTTGALTVSGGVGINENLNVDNNITTTNGQLLIQASTTSTTARFLRVGQSDIYTLNSGNRSGWYFDHAGLNGTIVADDTNFPFAGTWITGDNGEGIGIATNGNVTIQNSLSINENLTLKSGTTIYDISTDSGFTNVNDDQIATTLAIKNYIDSNAVGTSIDSSDTQIIFNSGGTLTGSSNLTYDGDTLIINEVNSSEPALQVNADGNAKIRLNDPSGNEFYTQITFSTGGTDRMAIEYGDYGDANFDEYFSLYSITKNRYFLSYFEKQDVLNRDQLFLTSDISYFQGTSVVGIGGSNNGFEYFYADGAGILINTDQYDYDFNVSTFNVYSAFQVQSSTNSSSEYVSIGISNDSTSTTTGAFRVDGGVGIAKNLYVGGVLGLASGTTIYNISTDSGFTSADNDSIATTLAIKNYIDSNAVVSYWQLNTNVLSLSDSGNTVNIQNDTTSTSPTTGALTVTGGVGIGGEVYIGDQLNISYTSNITSSNDRGVDISLTIDPPTTSAAQYTSINSFISYNGTQTLNNGGSRFDIVGDDISILMKNSATITRVGGIHIYNEIGENGATTLTDYYGAKIEGLFCFGNGETVQNFYGLHIGNGADLSSVLTNGYGLYIESQTNATNNYAIYTNDGIVSINDTTTSTSPTTGALTVVGGVGIAENLFVGEILSASQGFTNTQTLGNVNITAGSTDNVIIGDGSNIGSTTGQTKNVVIGRFADTDNSDRSVAIGYGAYSDDSDSVVIGHNASSDDINTVLIGSGTYGGGRDNVVIGYSASGGGVGANYSVSIGGRTYFDKPKSVVIGDYAASTSLGDIVIGADSYTDIYNTNGPGDIILGYGAIIDGDETIDYQIGSNMVKITTATISSYITYENVVGDTSGATGKIVWVNTTDNYLLIRMTSETDFVVGEGLSGVTSGENQTILTNEIYNQYINNVRYNRGVETISISNPLDVNINSINGVAENTQIIFNSGGTLTGSSNLTWNDTNIVVGSQPTITTSSGNRTVTQDFGRYFSDSQVLRAGEGHFENIKIQENFGIDSGGTYLVAMDSNSTNHLRIGIGLTSIGTIEFPRIVEITNSTTSTSTSTGALTVAGGIGVGDNLYVENNITISSGKIDINADISGDRLMRLYSSETAGQPLTWYARRDGYSLYIDIEDDNDGDIGSSDIPFLNVNTGDKLICGIGSTDSRGANVKAEAWNYGSGIESMFSVVGSTLQMDTDWTTMRISKFDTQTGNILEITNSSETYLTVDSSGFISLFEGTTINNISTDSGFTSADDNSIATTLAIKDYIDANAGGTSIDSSDTQIIFNSGGTLTGSSNLTFDNGILTLSGNTLRLTEHRTITSSGDTGQVGEISWDENYIYMCVADNTWKRTSLASW